MGLSKNQLNIPPPCIVKNTTHRRLYDIEKQLTCALSKNEFSLLFQPQFDSLSGTMIGVEALLRWDNSKIGHVSPSNFIPIAERSELIFPISDWVIRQVCRELKPIFSQKPEFRVSINLSMKEFLSPPISLTERLHVILAEEGVRASMFELEITETHIMENYAKAVPIMRALKTEGFHIACDDFGIGYSSLNRLKHLPIDTLKIDKSFIKNIAHDIHDNVIIKAILLIAKTFNFRVIAEGIEQASQVKALKALGCHLIQGYYFSKPISITEIIKMIGQ